MSAGPRLYTELAGWWPLLSPPSHYVEEAADLWPRLEAAVDGELRTLLELGCGGGSLAANLGDRLELCLTDLSPAMLEVSREVNPGARHVQGDMRELALGERFDVVLVHDAVMYLTRPADVRAMLATAARHCRPGGAVVVMPDHVRETFAPKTSTGGEDGADGRALRYLSWTWDPDADDDHYEVAYAFLLRAQDGSLRNELDRHRFGHFARGRWLSWFAEVGLEATSSVDPWARDVFVGRARPGARP